MHLINIVSIFHVWILNDSIFSIKFVRKKWHEWENAVSSQRGAHFEPYMKALDLKIFVFGPGNLAAVG